MLSNPNTKKQNLNPFIFPSDTDLGFALMVIAVLTVSMVYLWIATQLYKPFSQDWTTLTNVCSIQSFGKSTRDLAESNKILAINFSLELGQVSQPQSQQFLQCVTPIFQQVATFILMGIALIFIIAFILYMLYPILVLWRGHLVPLDSKDIPELTEYLAKLCRDAGLNHQPIFVWNPLNRAVSGKAFGRLGKTYVSLAGGLITYFYTEPAQFQAIVMHELAHLKNDDVNKTYFAMSIWWTFLLSFILFIGFVFQNGPAPSSTLMSDGLELCVIGAIIYLTRNLILRTREFYADVRASLHTDVGEALSNIFKTAPAAKYPFLSFFKTHPSGNERMAMVANANLLFKQNFLYAILLGALVQIIQSNLSGILSIITININPDNSTRWLVAALITIFIVGTLGTMTWRAALGKIFQPEIELAVGRTVLGFWLGLLIGNAFWGGWASWYFFVIENIVAGLLVLCLYFVLIWIVQSAQAWAFAPRSLGMLRGIYVVGLGIASFLLVYILNDLLIIKSLSEANGPLAFVATIFALLYRALTNPTVLLIYLLLWFFPLLSAFGQNTNENHVNWIWLEKDEKHPTERSEQKPFVSIKSGLIWGCSFGALVTLIRIIFEFTGLINIIDKNNLLVLFWFGGQFFLAVILQILLAYSVAKSVSVSSKLHGLFAALIGGCVMAAFMLLLNLLFGGTTNNILVKNTFTLIVNGGATTILVVYFIGWLFGSKRKINEAMQLP